MTALVVTTNRGYAPPPAEPVGRPPPQPSGSLSEFPFMELERLGLYPIRCLAMTRRALNQLPAW
jgi:hypothetical protein